jgi:hypothetical protein
VVREPISSMHSVIIDGLRYRDVRKLQLGGHTGKIFFIIASFSCSRYWLWL